MFPPQQAQKPKLGSQEFMSVENFATFLWGTILQNINVRDGAEFKNNLMGVMVYF